MPRRRKAYAYHLESRKVLGVLWVVAFVGVLIVLGAAFVLAEVLNFMAM